MFLANENFPRPSILLLREAGINVKSIQEDFQGIPDEQVIQIAKTEQLIILTFDKDYGELVFRYGAENPPAVIYFREKGQNPLFAGQILVSLLQQSGATFENTFTVIEQNGIRQRLYPNSKGS